MLGRGHFRNADTTTVLRTGLTTSAVTHDYAAGDEAIAFKASSFMPLMWGERMRDQGVVLSLIGKDRFRLGADVLEIPTFETVDGFVRKLVRNGNVEDKRVVASIVSGRHPSARGDQAAQALQGARRVQP